MFMVAITAALKKIITKIAAMNVKPWLSLIDDDSL